MNRLPFTTGPTGHYVWRPHHLVDLDYCALLRSSSSRPRCSLRPRDPRCKVDQQSGCLADPLPVLRCAVCGVRKHAVYVLWACQRMHSSDGHVSLYFDEITTVYRHLISEVLYRQRVTEGDREGTEGPEAERERKRTSFSSPHLVLLVCLALFALRQPGPPGKPSQRTCIYHGRKPGTTHPQPIDAICNVLLSPTLLHHLLGSYGSWAGSIIAAAAGNRAGLELCIRGDH